MMKKKGFYPSTYFLTWAVLGTQAVSYLRENGVSLVTMGTIILKPGLENW